MNKWQLFLMAALVALLVALLPPAIKWYEGERPYEVQVSTQMRQDLDKAIAFAAVNQNAVGLDECMVLVDRKLFEARYSLSYRGNLSNWVHEGLDNYVGLLCYNRDRDGKVIQTIVLWRAVEKPYFTDLRIGPVDLDRDVTGMIFLGFDKYGRTFLQIPSVYVQDGMIVDIP